MLAFRSTAHRADGRTALFSEQEPQAMAAAIRTFFNL